MAAEPKIREQKTKKKTEENGLINAEITLKKRRLTFAECNYGYFSGILNCLKC